MPDSTDLRVTPDTPSDNVLADRRRPGRIKSVNPELIPILRGQPDAMADKADIVFEERDQNAAARGIVTGVALSAPIWAVIVYVGRWVLS